MPLAQQKQYRLSQYVEMLEREGVLISAPAKADPIIAHVSCDSRDVHRGTLFICKGASFKQVYLEDAISKGAVAYVSEKQFDVGQIPCLKVDDIRAAMACLADAAYEHPSAKIKICAFTGTKGKTTSAFVFKSIMDARARRLGMRKTPIISTVMTYDGWEEKASHLTTPEAIELQGHIANAVENGCEELVMEASSQALKYQRVAHIEFAVAAFTNISEDHISPIEHPTFEDYFSSKLLIFKQCRTAVVNLDADHIDEIMRAAQVAERVVTYSLHNCDADIHVEDLRRERGMFVATLCAYGAKRTMSVGTSAEFNVSNALGAIACAFELGASMEDVEAGVSNISVPGRMQMVPSKRKNIVGIVDYAHNAVSLKALLTNVREAYSGHEIIAVFGSTGTKGRDRRVGMGREAGRLADYIVLTEDDAGKEDPSDICKVIAQNIRSVGNVPYEIELDRTAAIGKAVECAASLNKPAVVVVAGKGHEHRQLRAQGPVPYEGDAEVLAKAFSCMV